jgi:hypothetical protein
MLYNGSHAAAPSWHTPLSARRVNILSNLHFSIIGRDTSLESSNDDHFLASCYETRPNRQFLYICIAMRRTRATATPCWMLWAARVLLEADAGGAPWGTVRPGSFGSSCFRFPEISKNLVRGSCQDSVQQIDWQTNHLANKYESPTPCADIVCMYREIASMDGNIIFQAWRIQDWRIHNCPSTC